MTNEEMKKLVEGNSFDKWMDYTIELAKDGKAVFTFTGKAECHGNRRGQIHGGVTIAISDTVMGMACYSLGKSVCTQELNGNYLKPIMLEEKVRLEAEVVHNGNKTMVALVNIYGDDHTLRYTGRGTFFVLGTFTEEDARRLLAADEAR